MSSKSKSSQQQSTSQADNRVIASDAANTATGGSTALKDAWQLTGSGNEINMLDGNAIAAAFSFAKAQADANAQAFRDYQTSAGALVDKTISTLNPDMEKIKLFIWPVVGLIALMVWKGAKA